MQTKISKKSLVYYSLLAIPLAIVGLPLYIYLPTYYATIIGVEIASVGLIIFLARLTDVFTDPYFGYLSDKSIEYFNSRKPIMILGSFILICSFFALINPYLDFAKLWLLIFSILVYIGWSMINIPYLTWSSEISSKYEDKTLLNSSRELFTIIGILIALLIPYIFKVSQNYEQTLQVLYLSFLILFIPLFFITLKKVNIKTNIKVEKYSLKNLKNIYTNISDLKYLQIGYFFNNLANAIPATLFLLFIELVIQEKSSGGMVLILYFFSGIIALPFWNFLSSKIGKKNTWITSIVLASSAFAFVPFLQSGDLNAFIIISLISGLSLGADMAIPTSIQGDLVQRSKNYESNISGLLFGIWTMITKLSLAFAVALSFIILGFFDFKASTPTSNSLLVLSFLYGFFPVVLKLFAVFFIKKYSDIKE
ncbi:MAG: MFS transporter [Arcobacter sp.]|nr:MFS transporter [Arcobacter sp.]|tara:strand:+ start:7806 stop:9074 length:1269 start_codon:yes stop_codon:yes gene_type:complete